MTTNDTTPTDPGSHGPRPASASQRLASDPTVDLAPMWDLIKRLPAYVRLSTNLARDGRVPKTAKVTLALGGAYAVSPVDLIPGIIPVAGQLDDLYVLLTGLQQATRIAPDDVVREHLAAAGLEERAIDDDLAALRTFVRQGVSWAFQKSGGVALAASRQSREVFDWVRALGNRER